MQFQTGFWCSFGPAEFRRLPSASLICTTTILVAMGGKKKKADPGKTELATSSVAKPELPAASPPKYTFLKKHFRPKPKKKQPKPVAESKSDERNTGDNKWTYTELLLLQALLLVRTASARYSVPEDCDEVYNYWEPLHHLLHGGGLQTWEYSPTYALRYSFLSTYFVSVHISMCGFIPFPFLSLVCL